MERIEQRREIINQSLATLLESLNLIQEHTNQKLYKALRDSVIQRFEYSYETFSKFALAYLREIQKMSLENSNESPRAIFRALNKTGIISSEELEQLLEMADHRNRTSHLYLESTAQKVFEEIPKFYHLMVNLVQRME